MLNGEAPQKSRRWPVGDEPERSNYQPWYVNLAFAVPRPMRFYWPGNLRQTSFGPPACLARVHAAGFLLAFWRRTTNGGAPLPTGHGIVAFCSCETFFV